MGFQRLACRVWIFALRNCCERDKAQIETKRGNSVSKIIKQSGYQTCWEGRAERPFGLGDGGLCGGLRQASQFLGRASTSTLTLSVWAEEPLITLRAPGGTPFLGVSDERMCPAVAPVLCLGGLGSRYPQNLRWGHVVSGECPGFAPGPSCCPAVDRA